MIERSPHPDAGRLVYRCGAFRVRCACGMRANLDADLRLRAINELNRLGWWHVDRGPWRCPLCANERRRTG
jgi:hypothetical protein